MGRALLGLSLGRWHTNNNTPPTLSTSCVCALVSFVALVQLVRIQLRVPEYGWTTQKVFHLLNFLCFAAYAAALGLWEVADRWHHSDSGGLQFAALAFTEVPGLLFLTTYTLLVLFWAEIYHQARSHPLTWLKPAFVICNAVIYAVQILLWVLQSVLDKTHRQHQITSIASTAFEASVQFAAAMSFIVYGSLLFSMLYRFPIESKGRQKKLREVGSVAVVCSITFGLRTAAQVVYYLVLDLDPFKQPWAILGYITGCSLLPALFVLVMLRKLPPKKSSAGYQPIG